MHTKTMPEGPPTSMIVFHRSSIVLRFFSYGYPPPSSQQTNMPHALELQLFLLQRRSEQFIISNKNRLGGHGFKV
jgi:hypothetical protein